MSHELSSAAAASALRLELNVLNALQPEDRAAHLQLPEQGRRRGARRRRRSTCSDVDLPQGYDYNALIAATPDGANAYDPRYGMDDLFEPGTQGYFTVRFLF